MSSLNQYEVAKRWVSELESGGFSYRGRTLSADGLAIRSAWGREPLAQYLPRERGRRRPLILVTGDRWRSPGWGHTDLQTEVRTAAQRNELGADVLVIPFAALSAAGIIFESIRALEIRPDRNETFARTSERLKDLPSWERTYTETLTHSAETLDELPANQRMGYHWDETLGRHNYGERPRAASGFYEWTESVSRPTEPAADGLYHWTEHRHWLGDSVFTAEVRGSRTVTRPLSVADVVRIAAAAARAESLDSGLGVVETLERLDVHEPRTETVETRRRRRFVSSFDYQESPALYFLATLPRSSRAESVETAIEDLAPPAVHAAIARGRDVSRQGDIFAIATTLSTESVYALARSRARLTQLTRSARPRLGEVSYRPPLSAAGRRAFRRYRRARFLEILRAATERATSHEVGSPTTGETGNRAARRRARASGLEYLGQAARLGSSEPTSSYYRSNEYAANSAAERSTEYFKRSRSARVSARDHYRRLYGSNAVSAWSQANSAARSRFELEPVYLQTERERIRAALSVYGTSHSATEVVKARGGSVYLRGIMRHEPSLEPGRRGGRDHQDLPLGDRDTWYLAIRNTVPRGRALDSSRG